MFSTVFGFTTGFQSHQAKQKEDEVKQGGNYYQASLNQAMQISYLPTVTSPLFDQIPNPWVRTVLKICNQVVPLASWIICPTAAAVKQGHYETGVQVYNQLKKDRLNLIPSPPEKLNATTTKTFNFISKHAGDIAQASMLVGSCALMFFGSPLFGAALVTQYGIQKLSQHGYFPKKVSLVMEEKLPFVSDLCMLLGGGIVSRIASCFNILTSNKQFNQMLQTKIDSYTNEKASLRGPKLEEINSEVIIQKNLSYEKIIRLLKLSEGDFEITPAHCSKTPPSADLQSDFAFKDLLLFFDKIDWKNKTHILKKKFQDDERFNDYLKETIPEVSKDNLTYDESLKILLEKKQQSAEDFFAEQTRRQMSLLTLVLKGTLQGKGSLFDLEEARKDVAKILFFLKTLDFAKDSILIEDILMKLSIECGEYCYRGVKRAAAEIANSIAFQSMNLSDKNLNDTSSDSAECADILEKKAFKALFPSFDTMLAMLGGPDQLLAYHSYSYGDILTFFDKIDWKNKAELLIKKLQENSHLKESWVALQPRNLNLSTEELEARIGDFVIPHLREKMGSLVSSLQDVLENQAFSSQLKGNANLDKTRLEIAKIIFFLHKVSLEQKPDLVENILIELSFECGVASHEEIHQSAAAILRSQILKTVGIPDETSEVVRMYEFKMLQSLLFLRQNILDNTYLKFMEQLVSLVKNGANAPYISRHTQTTDVHTLALAQDIHTKDLYRISFALGFYPLSQHERDSFGMQDLLLWSSPAYPFREMRNQMYDVYYQRIDEAFQEIGEIHFSNYLEQFFRSNPNLSDSEVDSLLEKFTDFGDEEFLKENNRQFKRLVLFALGMLKLTKHAQEREALIEKELSNQKEVQQCLSDWVEVQNSEQDIVLDDFISI